MPKRDRDDDSSADDAKAKRLARLAAWKASQDGDTSTASAAPAPAAVPETKSTFAAVAPAAKPAGSKKPAFSMGGAKKVNNLLGKKGAAKNMKKSVMGGFDDDDEAKPKRGPPSQLFSPPASPRAASPDNLTDIESEVDPLDAFMNDISAEVKDSGVNMGGAMAMQAKEKEREKETLKTISWEEIQAMGDDGNKQGGTDDTAGGVMAVDDDGEDDDGDDSFRQAFLDAIKRRNDEEEEEKAKLAEAEKKMQEAAAEKEKEKANSGRFDEDQEEEFWVDFEEEESKYLEMLKKKKLAKELPPVDHATMDYDAFERCFYIEAEKLKKLSEEEVKESRKKLDNIRIYGKNCPAPVSSWAQCGLSNALLKGLTKHGCTKPFAIQAQALPAIMSGRDVIGVAKTGSGKTLAFVLPLFRHIQAQREIEDGEGPIGLIMAPTRELAVQIHTETSRFAKAINLTSVCAYGGAPISEQVSELKKGTEILVCTPGRCIDLLCLNNGRVTNLKRITYLVLDEADRMFDMGFEPQVLKIVANTRPDRQTVMFSATFPKIVEKHARDILTNPVQIVCGGVSVVSSTITQHVEIIDEHARCQRLVSLLGEWHSKGCVLVFVDRQDEADELFRDLLKEGYPALTLHGGKDQSDRDHTIADFKNKENTLMIATSVAARGLDVKDLVLVVNFSVPNHYEDYVHRVGRTGRAGKPGTAYTFITPEEDQYAGDLIKAIEGQEGGKASDELKALHNMYKRRVKEMEARGEKVYKSSGFKGKGFAFNEAEGEKDQAAKAMRAGVVRHAESDDDDDAPAADPNAPSTSENKTALAPAAAVPGAQPAVDAQVQLQAAMQVAAMAAKQNQNVAAALAAASVPVPAPAPAAVEKFVVPTAPTPAVDPAAAAAAAAAKAKAVAASISAGTPVAAPVAAAPAAPAGAANPNIAAALAKAAALAQKINAESAARALTNPPANALAAAQAVANSLSGGTAAAEPEAPGHFQQELEINDYPQAARRKALMQSTMSPILEFYAVCITTKGSWYAPGRNAPPGERKLHLLIEGPDESNIQKAKKEIRRMLEEAAAGVKEPTSFGRYSV